MDLTRKNYLPTKADIESIFQPLIKDIKRCIQLFSDGYQEWDATIANIESDSSKEAETLKKDLSLLEDECTIIADLEYDLEEIQAYMEANFGKLVVKGETPLDKMVTYMEQGMSLSKGGETFGDETTEEVVAVKFLCQETKVDQLKLKEEFQVTSNVSTVSQQMQPRKGKKVNTPPKTSTISPIEQRICKKMAKPKVTTSLKMISIQVPPTQAEFQRQQKFDQPPSSYFQQQKKEAKMLDVPPGFEDQQQKCYLAVPPGFETRVTPSSTPSTKAFNQNVFRLSSEKLKKSKTLQRRNSVQECQKLEPFVLREIHKNPIDKIATSLCGRERLAAQDYDKIPGLGDSSCEYQLQLILTSFFILPMARQNLSWKDKPPESIWEIQC